MDRKIQALLDSKGREVYSIQADQTVYEAITEMDARNVGGLIVKDGDEIVGIITERDYTRKVILKDRSSKETPVRTIMTHKLVSVTPDHTVIEAMAIMTEKRCRQLTALRKLSAWAPRVTDGGLEHLKGLTKLRTLSLGGTQTTDAGVKKLQEALPQCNIEH